jgi:adenylosuccinate lyase
LVFPSPITQQQIDETMKSIDAIKYQITVEREQKVGHDVMVHLSVFGKKCLNAWKEREEREE